MSQTPEWPPSPEAMHALLPAFEFTSMVTANDLGSVYFANQKSLDRQVAVKVFSSMLAADAAFRNSFENASKLAAGLRHTNLIGILDSGRAGGMPYLVMEFVPGKSLAHSTRGQVVDFAQSLGIIDAICEGLAHSHDAGLVHGHLDTLSVLLNQHAVPKIGSFGFGRAVHTDPDIKAPRHFTAPEVLVEPTSAKKTSDVFSLAAIFHELITGQPFSPGSPPASTICKCRPAVDGVLKRATDPDPEKRFEDARAFQTALKNATEPPRKAASSSVPARAAAATPATVISAAPESGEGLKRAIKLAIIVVLLFAIYFSWEVLKKSRIDREKQGLEIIAKQEASKAAAAALIAEQQALVDARRLNTRPNPEVQPRLEKKPETPAESLTRLCSALASGRRSEMPVGSVKKGDSHYFMVDQAMSWAEAAQFAEEHGAHLADPGKDLSWLQAELTKGRECWLGAARSGEDSWVRIDGKPWSPPSKPDGKGLFLIAAKSGGFASADEISPRPFVIEWLTDGSNPGSLANLLAVTRASLEGASPIYPPGTVVSGNRRYLFVPRPLKWNQARDLAKDGGGHLVVAASKEEIEDLNKLARSIKAREGIWLGGSLEDDHWIWVTGETWHAAGWAENSDASETKSALIIRPGKGWVAMNRGDTASGFIIEWSDDKSAAKSEGTRPASGDKTAELNARVKELILTAMNKRDADHAANVKKYQWDLTAFLRNLPKSGQEQWGRHVEALKECVANDHVIVDMIREQRIAVSTETAKIINYCAEKQDQIDAKFLADTGKIRDAYLVKLAVIRDEAKAAGQTKVASDADEATRDAADLKSWLRPFGVDFDDVTLGKVREYRGVRDDSEDDEDGDTPRKRDRDRDRDRDDEE